MISTIKLRLSNLLFTKPALGERIAHGVTVRVVEAVALPMVGFTVVAAVITTAPALLGATPFTVATRPSGT